MECFVSTSTIGGSLTIPPSKSQTMRALCFALMASGESVIKNYLNSPDVEAMVNAIQTLGAVVRLSKGTIFVRGTGGKPSLKESFIDSGNSGQVFRFMGAMASLSDSKVILSGDQSIQTKRPILPLLEGIASFGGKISTAPVSVQGPIRSGEATIEGIDSQPVSALLMALSFAKGPFALNVLNPGELPWIDLTLSWLDRFHIPYTNYNYRRYEIQGGAAIKAFHYTVPADYSSLAFPIAAALVTNGRLVIDEIDLSDCQGDKKLVYTLQKMGAKIEIDEKARRVIVHPGSTLSGGRIDLNEMIDAVCILAVLGCFASGKVELYNGLIARSKESDRLSAMSSNLKAMGADIAETADGLVIAPSKLKGATLHSFSDHRVAMAMIIASLAAEGESRICNIECIAKSYPRFCEKLQSIGAQITLHGGIDG